MRTIDFLAEYHGVQLLGNMRHLPVLEQCKFIAANSKRLENAEPYWIFVAALTALKNPKTCPVWEPVTAYADLEPIAIDMDFDETVLETETYEKRFALLESMFNTFVQRPSLVQGGKVNNLEIYEDIADSLGYPVELVITLHALEWDSNMRFRPGAIEYIRTEVASGREIRIVSSSYVEIVVARLISQGQTVRWADDFQAYWVFPEGEVLIVGRNVDADWAKPHPHIHQTSIDFSEKPLLNHVAFEDSPSGTNGAKAAGIETRIGVGTREDLDVCHRISDFVGFSPTNLDEIWRNNVQR